jgi:hypothetical protein
LVDHRFDLLGRDVLSGHEYVFVERHIGPFFGWIEAQSTDKAAKRAVFARSIGAKPFEPSMRPERLSKAETRDDGSENPAWTHVQAVRSAPGRSEREGGLIAAFGPKGKEPAAVAGAWAASTFTESDRTLYLLGDASFCAKKRCPPLCAML